MRKLPFILIIILIVSCNSTKKVSSNRDRNTLVAAAQNSRNLHTPSKTKNEVYRDINTIEISKTEQIINTAISYLGTPYKYGGTSKQGIDCSGLLYLSFANHDVSLPRTSIQMAEHGKRIKVKDIKEGDLIFFKTKRSFKRVNHVGLVISTDNNDIKFIHASGSKGVTISYLRQEFWNHAFVKATRIL